MDRLETILAHNEHLLHSLDIQFKKWRHEPILNTETDLRVSRALGWTGTLNAFSRLSQTLPTGSIQK